MTNVVIISVALAVTSFFAWHIVSETKEAMDGKRKREEIEKLQRELNDEILHGGNVARMVVLRKRLQELLSR